MEDKKDRIIELLIEKNKLINELAELYFEEGAIDLNKKQLKRHEEIINRNSKILLELTELGYAKRIKNER